MNVIVVSSLCRVEVPAAIWRKHRAGELGEGDAAALVGAFEADYHGADDRESLFAVVEATQPVLREAARLVAVHALRAYDAVQLASALSARRADADCAAFACFDHDLKIAGSAEGFETIL